MKVKPGDLLEFYPHNKKRGVDWELNLVLKLTPNETWDFEVWSFYKKRSFRENFTALGADYKKINLKKELDKE